MAGALVTVNRVSEVIGIGTGAREQLSGVSQVNEAVLQMDNMTRQNAALVEQVAASAVQLQGQALAVTESVQVFRLDSGAVVRQDAVALRKSGAAAAQALSTSSSMTSAQTHAVAARQPEVEAA